jgi:hypothetical protein
MAFRLIKLVSSETLLADTYHVSDLTEQFKAVKHQEKPLEFVFGDEKVVFLINPLELIYRLTEDGALTTILAHFMPHAEDIIFPIPHQKIISMGCPDRGILKSYFSFLTENPKHGQGNSDLKECLLSKDICSSEADKILSIFNSMGDKKTTKQ